MAESRKQSSNFSLISRGFPCVSWQNSNKTVENGKEKAEAAPLPPTYLFYHGVFYPSNIFCSEWLFSAFYQNLFWLYCIYSHIAFPGLKWYHIATKRWYQWSLNNRLSIHNLKADRCGSPLFLPFIYNLYKQKICPEVIQFLSWEIPSDPAEREVNQGC